MPIVNEEIKQKWVNALLTGNYKQGRGMLFKRDKSRHTSYCCLGVLGKECGVSTEDMRDNGFLWDDYTQGLTWEEMEGLATLNDFGVPFAVIAGFIQENM